MQLLTEFLKKMVCDISPPYNISSTPFATINKNSEKKWFVVSAPLTIFHLPYLQLLTKILKKNGFWYQPPIIFHLPYLQLLTEILEKMICGISLAPHPPPSSPCNILTSLF